MISDITKIQIEDARGTVVGVLYKKGDQLNGLCEWHNSSGELISFGYFENGLPVAGSFLNWSLFFGPPPDGKPYAITYYNKDWVTSFEESFLSSSPKYEVVLEFYSNGVKIK